MKLADLVGGIIFWIEIGKAAPLLLLAPCKVVGIGSIQIKMHDEIVRTLIEVCHVLGLKKNLVFVGAMDSKGFSGLVDVLRSFFVGLRSSTGKSPKSNFSIHSMYS